MRVVPGLVDGLDSPLIRIKILSILSTVLSPSNALTLDFPLLEVASPRFTLDISHQVYT